MFGDCARRAHNARPLKATDILQSKHTNDLRVHEASGREKVVTGMLGFSTPGSGLDLRLGFHSRLHGEIASEHGGC